MIKRYNSKVSVCFSSHVPTNWPDPNGDWVKYEDHLEEIAKRNAIIKALRSELGTYDIDTTPNELQRLREEE